jgi:hypothetical protein
MTAASRAADLVAAALALWAGCAVAHRVLANLDSWDLVR